jgi:hypothetical protein
MLHAGRLTAHEHDENWLAQHTREIRAWSARIEVRHDPVLTARVIASASGVRAGRRMLASIGVADVVRLVRRYREEYASALLSPSEVTGWVRAVAEQRARSRTGRARRDPSAPVVLAFPNRVTVNLRGGGTESVTVNEPVGAFGVKGVENELRQKFIRESGAVLGAGVAEEAWTTGLALESVPLERFIELCTPTPRA